MLRLLPDPAANETDRILSNLESRIKKEYKQALKEADAKWQKYMKSFEAADAKEADRLASGEITKQQYQEWRLRHLSQGKQWEEMRNVLAHDYHNRNVIAAKLTNGTMADVYAVNANYGTYLVEHGAKIDTAFSLYNHDTAEALLKEEWSVSPETGKNSFLPKPSEKKKRELAQAKRENPDVLWNKQKLQSVMIQGVLSGEPLTQLAKRLAGVAEMDEHQAIRNARTMTTNVQSKGRMDAFDRAAGLGVELMDEWVAILDGATRHSHRHMHGERKPHDSKVPFSNGCTRPGDPSGPAAEVYNCRCRVISWVKGFEGDTVKKNPSMGDMSFEEWQNAKAPKKKKASLTRAAESGNLETDSATDQFVREFESYKPQNIENLAVSERAKEDVRYAVAGMKGQEREVWEAAIENAKYVSDTDSFYDPILGATHIEKDATGRIILHETAHALDEGSVFVRPNEWATIKSASAYVEHLVSEAEIYGDAQKDIVTFCNKLGIKLNADGDWLSGEPDFITKFRSWADSYVTTHGDEHFRAVSDFVDGMTLGEMNAITRNYGHHPQSYWTEPYSGQRGSPAFDEQWAHYCSLRAERRTDEISILEEIAPNRMSALAKVYGMVFGA